jgi:hypothetical protein
MRRRGSAAAGIPPGARPARRIRRQKQDEQRHIVGSVPLTMPANWPRCTADERFTWQASRCALICGAFPRLAHMPSSRTSRRLCDDEIAYNNAWWCMVVYGDWNGTHGASGATDSDCSAYPASHALPALHAGIRKDEWSAAHEAIGICSATMCLYFPGLGLASSRGATPSGQ